MQAIFDLEATNQDLKPLLRDLYITSAKEIEVQGNARKAVVVHVRTAPFCSLPVCCLLQSLQIACTGLERELLRHTSSCSTYATTENEDSLVSDEVARTRIHCECSVGTFITQVLP